MSVENVTDVRPERRSGERTNGEHNELNVRYLSGSGGVIGSHSEMDLSRPLINSVMSGIITGIASRTRTGNITVLYSGGVMLF